MTSIKNIKLTYLSLAIITALVMAFVVLPQLPQVKSTLGIGTTVDQAEAWGSSCGDCNDPINDDDGDHTVDHDPKPTQTVTAKCTISPSTITVEPGKSVSLKVTPSRPTNNGTRFESYLKYENQANKKIYSGQGGGNNYRLYEAGVNGNMLTKPGTYTFSMGFNRTGYNDYSCTAKIIVKETPKPAAKCDAFSVSPNKLPHGGGNVKFTWNTTNATKVTINNGVGTVAADGSKTVNVTGTKTFTLTAYGTGGNDTCTTKVTVEAPKVAKCDSFTATPSSLPYGGGNVTLKWNTTNANSVSISGVGSVPVDGSKTVHVTSGKTFTLTADGTNGDDTCTTKVTVGSPEAPVCKYLTASDTSVAKGTAVTLNWDTVNASDVSINNGIGSVSKSGSRSVVINNDITYILTAKNDGKQDTCVVHIDVEDEPEEETPRCDFFDVDDDSVEEGDRVELSWGTTNADSVRINEGIGSVSKDGDISVRVYDDVTFILTATNGNKEDTCRVDVEVDEEDDEPRPRCELDVSDNRVKRGEEVTLEWETDHAEEITIEDDHGDEIFSSSRSKYFDGEIDVRIYEDTEFTLIVEGKDDDRECDVDVRVEDEDITVYEKRDQDLVIALTQVPYTGFEAGPFLTYLFYGVLTLWALFIAYILVVRKGSVLGFSLYGATATDKVASDSNERKKVEALVAKYAGRNW